MSDENVLVFLSGYSSGLDEFPKLCLVDENARGKVVEFGGWFGYKLVNGLCFHNGVLYDSRGVPESKDEDYVGGVRETLSGKLVAKREDYIVSMCSNDGELYDVDNKGKVRLTFSNEVLTGRGEWGISELCSHKGVLLETGDYGIRETISGRRRFRDKSLNDLKTLCSHDGKLYFMDDDSTIGTAPSSDEFYRSKWNGMSLGSHNGKLLVGGRDNSTGIIRDLLTGDVVAKKEVNIYSMCSVPRSYFVEAGILK